MKAAAPELFHEQPDLLYQLVTLMSPGRLRKAGVRVNVCDQRPREFVITMPRAYHAGFNHDFNYNEAVNFCLPDWLQHGGACVTNYKLSKKTPVFSHDALLLNIFHSDTSAQTANWLLPHLRLLFETELDERVRIRKECDDYFVGPEQQLRQCSIDQSYCSLSYVADGATDQIWCLSCAAPFLEDHERDISEVTFYTCIEDHSMLQMLDDLKARMHPGQSNVSCVSIWIKCARLIMW